MIACFGFVLGLTVFSISASVTVAAAAKPAHVYEMKVTVAGYEPASLKVKAGEPVTLKITRTTEATCANEIVVPSLKINKPLPLGKEVTVNLGPLKKGEIKFGCSMGMMLGGSIHVE